MMLIPASRQILNASASLGTISRAAGVSIAAPDATKSFCMSMTIIAVFVGSITSICMASSEVRSLPPSCLSRSAGLPGLSNEGCNEPDDQKRHDYLLVDHRRRLRGHGVQRRQFQSQGAAGPDEGRVHTPGIS